MKSGLGLFHEDLLLTHNRAPVICKLYFQATWPPTPDIVRQLRALPTLPQTALHPCLYLPIVLIKETSCENMFPKGKAPSLFLGRNLFFLGRSQWQQPQNFTWPKSVPRRWQQPARSIPSPDTFLFSQSHPEQITLQAKRPTPGLSCQQNN